MTSQHSNNRGPVQMIKRQLTDHIKSKAYQFKNANVIDDENLIVAR